MNVFVFGYFLLHRSLVTDFSEPPNLFALAVNSPPSHAFAGSCGGGPTGKQYMVNWFVNHEGSHLYMEPGEKTQLLGEHGHAHVHDHDHDHAGEGDLAPSQAKSHGAFLSSMTGTIKRGLRINRSKVPTKLSEAGGEEPVRRPGSAAGSDVELEDGHTRRQRHYTKLANRRSML